MWTSHNQMTVKRKDVGTSLFTTKKKEHMQELRATKLICNLTACPYFQQLPGHGAEQHYAIKLCVRLKKNTAETILLRQEAFGNEVLGLVMIKR